MSYVAIWRQSRRENVWGSCSGQERCQYTVQCSLCWVCTSRDAVCSARGGSYQTSYCVEQGRELGCAVLPSKSGCPASYECKSCMPWSSLRASTVEAQGVAVVPTETQLIPRLLCIAATAGPGCPPGVGLEAAALSLADGTPLNRITVHAPRDRARRA